MPGVPSGRGCDECRRQKKKCDLAQPSCSRCARIGIPCIGCGKQRFKYKIQTAETRSRRPNNGHLIPFVAFPHVPQNDKSHLANRLVALLDVTDVRYDVSSYGIFLGGIPMRLGRSPALDNAAYAFTACAEVLYTGHESVRALSSYQRALKSLRESIHTPSTAHTIETMCAIYLVLICQGWLGSQQDRYITHGEGIVYLLKIGATQKWRDFFEIQMLLTLCVPVVIESMCNPRINLDSWFWKLLDTYEPILLEIYQQPINSEDYDFSSLELRYLAHITNYVNNPNDNQDALVRAYNQMRSDEPKLRKIWEEVLVMSQAQPEVELRRAARDYATAYSVMLTLMMILNGVQQAMGIEDVALADDANWLITETIAMGRRVLPCRPLGAEHFPFCLTVAWALAEPGHQLDQVTNMMRDWQQDFTQTRWMELAFWWKSKFDGLRVRQDGGGDVQLLRYGEAEAFIEAEAELSKRDACCIL